MTKNQHQHIGNFACTHERNAKLDKTPEETRQMKSCKAICGYFPALQIQVYFRGITGKLKGITFPTKS